MRGSPLEVDSTTQRGERWEIVVDTSGELQPDGEVNPDKPVPVADRAIVVLTRQRRPRAIMDE